MTSRVSRERTLYVKRPIQLLFIEQFLADKRVTGTPSAVGVVRLDEGREFKGDFTKIFRKLNIRQEFTTADGAKFNGVAMVKSAGMAAQDQTKPLFVDSRFRLVADCGLHATIRHAMRSTVRELVPMEGINCRLKYVLVRYLRARSLSSSQST